MKRFLFAAGGVQLLIAVWWLRPRPAASYEGTGGPTVTVFDTF
jgi:hypothetical protein